MVCVNGDGIGLPRVSARDRIKAALGEGMATSEPAERQPGAADRSKTDQRDVGVLGAGGQVEALRRAEGVQNRRDNGFVDPEGDADGEAGFIVVVVRHFGTPDTDFRRFGWLKAIKAEAKSLSLTKITVITTFEWAGVKDEKRV